MFFGGHSVVVVLVV